jgi:hypothetical protein
MRTQRVILLALMLVGVLVGAPSVQAQAPAGADCALPEDESLHFGSSPTPEGYFPHEEWAGNAVAQASIAAVEAAPTATFGETDDDERASLSRGLVGSALDHHARQLVVIVDPTLVSDLPVLAARLQDLVGPVLSIRVIEGCNSAAELLPAEAVIDQRAWHPRAQNVAYGVYLDPRTATFNVTFNASDRDVAEALKNALGDSVTIEYGEPERRGRLDDGEPHWGGAGIGRPRSNNFCTSGFAVRLANGNLGSVTAGHCFSNGQNIWSGPHYYGRAGGESNFPRFDMIRINPNGERFSPRIHTDPGSPSSRTVVSSGNPRRNSFVCVSGMVTRAKCGLEVTSTSAQLCDPSGCTRNLFRAVQPGETVGAGGDSGAPVYNRFARGTAAIRGMEIGGTSRSNILAHKVSSIEAHLNVDVVP